MSIPPKYSDLGKAARDLFTKGYNHGFYKLEAKTKTASEIEFKTSASLNHDSGKFFGNLETKYKWQDYGLTLLEKWNTDNNLGTEITVEDKLLNGLKLSFETLFSPQSGKKNGKIKAEYEREYLHKNVDIDFDFAGPTILGACVFGYSGWLGGCQMVFDTAKSKMTQNNFALGFSKDDVTVHVAVNDGSEVQGSVFKKVNDKLEAGAQLNWSGANNTRFGVAIKYLFHPDSIFRMRVHNNAQIGLSYEQKIHDGVSVTLSSLVEGKTFNQGGHKVGIGLEFEP